mmetsp:Transcript_130871/g.298044  ORF Transcript_130871/g.298044 Transcript_130871/m.298044 type:complete len:237 (+) Transcript_130871:476-1186(+)
MNLVAPRTTRQIMLRLGSTRALRWPWSRSAESGAGGSRGRTGLCGMRCAFLRAGALRSLWWRTSPTGDPLACAPTGTSRCARYRRRPRGRRAGRIRGAGSTARSVSAGRAMRLLHVKRSRAHHGWTRLSRRGRSCLQRASKKWVNSAPRCPTRPVPRRPPPRCHLPGSSRLCLEYLRPRTPPPPQRQRCRQAQCYPLKHRSAQLISSSVCLRKSRLRGCLTWPILRRSSGRALTSA